MTAAVNATVVVVVYADRNFGNLSVLYRSQSSSRCFDIRGGISGKQLYTLRKAIISGSPRHLYLNINQVKRFLQTKIFFYYKYLCNNFRCPSGTYDK
jgi:hypothetical protein